MTAVPGEAKATGAITIDIELDRPHDFRDEVDAERRVEQVLNQFMKPILVGSR